MSRRGPNREQQERQARRDAAGLGALRRCPKCHARVIDRDAERCPACGADVGLVAVRFFERWTLYNAGEVAGVPVETARGLFRRQVAEPVDGDFRGATPEPRALPARPAGFTLEGADAGFSQPFTVTSLGDALSGVRRLMGG